MTSNSPKSAPHSNIAELKHWPQKNPKTSVAIIALVILIAFILASSKGGNVTSAPDNTEQLGLGDAIAVVVATAREDTLNISLSGLGVVTPLNTVEVGSRVNGQLIEVAFEDGQVVKAGDLLAQIDPRPFEVELRTAQSQLVRDKSLLDRARVDTQRYQKLLEQDSISVEIVDTKASLVKQYKTAVQAGEARVTNANLQLKYASIRAPISGRVGFKKISVGNILSADESSAIVSITQLDPISVIFPIPEDNLPKVIKLLNSGNSIPVDIYDRAKKDIIGKGELVATDNKIDAATGTIKLKAQLSNSDGSLFANQFVNVEMVIESRPNAVMIPSSAIQRGNNGDFVYLVSESETVTVTPVVTGPTEGKYTSIEMGLSKNQRVVVEGADRLRNNASIKIIERNSPDSQSQP